jgi:hypothetical protein
MTKDEALKLALIIEEFDGNDESLPLELLKPIAETLRALAQPVQSVSWTGNDSAEWRAIEAPTGFFFPVDGQTQPECARCKELEEHAYDLLGQLKVANLKWSVAHPWVGLTDDAEIFAISNTMPYANRFEFARAIEAKLKEKNNG